MNSNREYFNVKPTLDSLRRSVGDSEFGYRMQALFAHGLLELGGTITEINQRGHPDVKWVKDGRTSLFQVKSITHSYGGWALTVSAKDIAGIRPSRLEEDGYFAVLDCAVPVSWVVSGYDAIQRHETCSVSVETIRASADLDLSREISRAFTELVMRLEDNLHLLTFSILRSRALRGERL